MGTHKDLDVWQLSMDFVIDIYKLTSDFPKEEKYGLSSQIKRASVSIPSNIAEGAARKNTKEFIQFLYYSLGSAAEIETQLELAKRLDYVKNTDNIDKKLHSLIRMLVGLIKSLKNKIN